VLALASLTGGDRSIGIIRLRTKTLLACLCFEVKNIGNDFIGKSFHTSTKHYGSLPMFLPFFQRSG
jgi:hypothetical protein